MTDPGANTPHPPTPTLDIGDFTDFIPFANASAALELLLTVKNGIRNTAVALTECATPEVREVVKAQLFQSLDMHERLSQLMIDKGWLHPHELPSQFAMDLRSAQMTANIAKLPLFKDRTKVLEAFDTPQQPN